MLRDATSIYQMFLQGRGKEDMMKRRARGNKPFEGVNGSLGVGRFRNFSRHNLLNSSLKNANDLVTEVLLESRFTRLPAFLY